MTIDELPSAQAQCDYFCDPCMKKGVQIKTAKVFCTACKRKYCAVHEEVCNGDNRWFKNKGILS